jgi:hypothetical protein
MRISDHWDNVLALMCRFLISSKHADDAGRAIWVEGLWQDLYRKIGDSMCVAENFWDHIRINTLFTHNYPSGNVYGWDETKSVISITYFMGVQKRKQPGKAIL